MFNTIILVYALLLFICNYIIKLVNIQRQKRSPEANFYIYHNIYDYIRKKYLGCNGIDFIMVKAEGISGLTKLFREALVDVDDASTILFVGSEAVCPPFAQLLAYAVRDHNMRFGFCPRAEWENSRTMRWVAGAGFQISKDPFEPGEADVIVILGGLAIPKFGCPVEDVKALISQIPKHRLVIAVGFMDAFRKAGWNSSLHFDVLIDGYMSAEVL